MIVTSLWQVCNCLIISLHSSVCKCGDKSVCIFSLSRRSTTFYNLKKARLPSVFLTSTSGGYVSTTKIFAIATEKINNAQLLRGCFYFLCEIVLGINFLRY